MNYRKVSIAGVDKNQIAVQLDSGEFVVLGYEVLRDGGNCLALHAMATVVTELGEPVLDENKLPWTTEYRHACDQYSVDQYGIEVLIRELFYMLMGETMTPRIDHPELKIVDVSPDIVSTVSIRRTLDVAAAVSPTATIDLSKIL
ncbi:MAG TPA: hypothetical protein VF928_09195 [Usitatibacteraceae bacterium]